MAVLLDISTPREGNHHPPTSAPSHGNWALPTSPGINTSHTSLWEGNETSWAPIRMPHYCYITVIFPTQSHSPPLSIYHMAAGCTHSIAHAACGHHLVQISLAPFHPGSFKKISADYIKGFIRFLLSWVRHIIQMVSKENCYLLIAGVAASYQMSGFCCL